MTRFRRRVTSILGNIFDFVGPKSNLSEVDLSGSIQPVFNLAPGAARERAASFGLQGGMFQVGLTMAHVGAGTIFDTIADLVAAQQAAFNEPELDLWIYNVSCSATLDAMTNALVVLGPPAPVSGNARPTNLAFWDTFGAPSSMGSAAVMTHAGASPFLNRMPYKMLLGQDIFLASVATGATTVIFNLEVYVGPRHGPVPW